MEYTANVLRHSVINRHSCPLNPLTQRIIPFHYIVQYVSRIMKWLDIVKMRINTSIEL